MSGPGIGISGGPGPGVDSFGPSSGMFGPGQSGPGGPGGHGPHSMHFHHRHIQASSVIGESFFVGAFAVLTGFTAFTLLRNRRTMPAVLKALFGSSFLMFLISIIHVAMQGQLATFRGFQPDLRTAADVLALCQFVLSDLILMWRVWTVWDKKWTIMVAPIITFVAAVASTIFSIAGYRRNFIGTIITVCLIILNTIICAGLILFRMRRTNSNTSVSTSPSKSGKFFAFVIGSGILIAVYAIIGLVVFLSPVPGFSIMRSIQVPLVGILSTLILLLAFLATPLTESKEIQQHQHQHQHQQQNIPAKELHDDDADSMLKKDFYNDEKV